jgi:hypothetical protein
MRKLSKRHLDEDQLAQELKSAAEKDPTVQAKFKEYGIDISELPDVKIGFEDLDVSAKTKNEAITLNRKLLSPVSKAFEQCMPYVVHELTHVLQQKKNQLHGADKEEYLDKDTEIEAFQAQVEYKKDHDGEDAADAYVEDLLDFHNIKRKKRLLKKRVLMDGQ